MFDVRIFNPFARASNRLTNLSATYKKHEREKKGVWSEGSRCGVCNASFSPLVLSLTGGLGREETCVYKRLSSQLATKWQQPYSKILYWVRITVTTLSDASEEHDPYVGKQPEFRTHQ